MAGKGNLICKLEFYIEGYKSFLAHGSFGRAALGFGKERNFRGLKDFVCKKEFHLVDSFSISVR